MRVVQQAVDSGRWVPLIEHDLAIGQSHVVLPLKFAWAVGKADLILLDNLATLSTLSSMTGSRGKYGTPRSKPTSTHGCYLIHSRRCSLYNTGSYGIIGGSHPTRKR